MSRIALALLATVGAQPPSAEQALANYRRLTQPVRCTSSAGSEIVVCGRRDHSRDRLPLRDERGLSNGAAKVRGEIPAASAARVRGTSCGVADRGEVCSVGVPVVSVRDGKVAFPIVPGGD